jgi:hypothetical protein
MIGVECIYLVLEYRDFILGICCGIHWWVCCSKGAEECEMWSMLVSTGLYWRRKHHETGECQRQRGSCAPLTYSQKSVWSVWTMFAARNQNKGTTSYSGKPSASSKFNGSQSHRWKVSMLFWGAWYSCNGLFYTKQSHACTYKVCVNTLHKIKITPCCKTT